MNQIQLSKIQSQTEGGRRLGQILQKLLSMSHGGVSLLSIEDEAQRLIKEAHGFPSFQTVADYKWATCLCVNDEVVHGIPKEYILLKGDVLTIDVGMIYEGYHTDTAWTIIVDGDDRTDEEAHVTDDLLKVRLLDVGKKALWEAIDQAKAGNRIGHISQAIHSRISQAGYSIIKSLVGHTVGKELHEKPQVPGYLKGSIENTPVLHDGMTLAIEVIYAQGQGGIVYSTDDGWTLATKDRSLSAVFEHTICIDGDCPKVLTGWEK